MTIDFTPIRQLDVRRRLSDGHRVLVGRLAQNRQGVFFQYDDAYCREHHSLSPFQLPFDARLHAVCDVNYFGRLATIKMAGWVG